MRLDYALGFSQRTNPMLNSISHAHPAKIAPIPPITPLRALPPEGHYRKGDVLVVFGELFSRGYANGIVDEAEAAGMTVVRSTVGRRTETGELRRLNETELSTQSKPFINIPLEAGFDMERASNGTSPVEQLKSVKLSAWNDVKLDWQQVEESRLRGVERFRKNVSAYMLELDQHIPKGANVIFLHTMAGGVPRAKIMMPLMNRVFKGVGDRHMSSLEFWNSELGRLCSMSFDEVTANTFEHLVELSQAIRDRLLKEGGSARYLAYGYHGTEVMIRGEYVWQTYAPYIQGWAKRRLEDLARHAWAKGVKACVYNCPEILTNSSSIFVGVEVPLYPLLSALRKEGVNSVRAVGALTKASALLKPEFTFADIQIYTDRALSSEAIRAHCNFSKWPEHNSKDQMETLIAASEGLVEMHTDSKELITAVLSEEIFRACGYIMFHDSWKLETPVIWLGHDVIAKALASDKII